MRGTTFKRYLTPAIWTLLFLFNLIVFVPWRPILSKSGLDASWAMSLQWAFLNHKVFGREFVLTYGPWGFLCQGYDPATYGLAMAMWTLLAGAFFGGVYQIAAGRGRWAGVLPAGGIFVLAGLRLEFASDLKLLALSWLLLLVHFRPGSGSARARAITGGGLAVAAALASLCKFSIAIATGSIVVLIAIDQLRQRRIPWTLFLYTAGVVLLWVAARQPLGGFLAYVSNSFEIAGGYSAGESLTLGEPLVELVQVFMFLLSSVLLIAAMSVNRPGQPDGSRYFFIAGIMLAIFILFRIGYVRHDAHETIATVGLSLLCLMHVASMPFLTARRRMFRALNATALLCCFGLAWISINRWTGTGLEQHLANPLSAIPSGDELRQQYEEHVREFRVSIPPISAASRGVDVIPVLQAAVFAHGLPFQPRPMIHSYLAFTPRLMKLNADFLHDPTRAPDSILFDICTIDHRFPSQDDALSWLEILSRYEPRHESGDLLLLERAAEPKTYSFESERRQRVEMGRWVVIPQADHPVWIRIDLKRTAGGALVEAIYKLPPVVLQIRTADGIEESFRLIPPVARSGFLLSPAITDRGEFEALYAPDWQQRLNGRLVQQMRLLAGTETGTSSNYEQNFDLSVAQLVVAPR